MMNAMEVVSAFQKATVAGDFVALRKLVHDSMTFRGPFDTFEAPEPYIEALKKLQTIIKGTTVLKMFVDGDDVGLFYEMETASPAGTAFIAEWFHVRAGKVASIRAVFDARPFAAMFSKPANCNDSQ